jgi:hypothetical protein
MSDQNIFSAMRSVNELVPFQGFLSESTTSRNPDFTLTVNTRRTIPVLLSFKEIEKIEKLSNKPIDVISVSEGYPEFNSIFLTVYILDFEQTTLDKAVYRGKVNTDYANYNSTLVFSLSRETKELVIRSSYTGAEKLERLDGVSIVGRAEVRQICK